MNLKTLKSLWPFAVLLIAASCGVENLYRQTEPMVVVYRSIESYWEQINADWTMKDGMFESHGRTDDWAILLSKETLPAEFEIEMMVNMVEGELFELMVNTQHQKYVRAYLYTIEQKAKLGKGELDRNNTNRPGGGKTLFSQDLVIENGKWYELKARYEAGVFTFYFEGEKALEYSLVELGLSTSGKLGLLSNGNTLVKDLKISAL